MDQKMLDNLGSKLVDLRKVHGFTQSELADMLYITHQAISQWENGVTLPDLLSLLKLCDIYHITLNEMFGMKSSKTIDYFQHDNVTRIIAIKNGKILKENKIKDADKVEVIIEGNINGNVQSNFSIKCGNVEGTINCGNWVTCLDVTGDVKCGNYIECQNVGNDAHCGNYIEAKNIIGNASCGSFIKCENIEGNARAGGDVNCVEIHGNVEAEGDVTCNTIKGSVNCENIYNE